MGQCRLPVSLSAVKAVCSYCWGSQDSSWDVEWSNTRSTSLWQHWLWSKHTILSMFSQPSVTSVPLDIIWAHTQILIYLFKGHTRFTPYKFRTDFINTSIVFKREYWTAPKYRNWNACSITEPSSQMQQWPSSYKGMAISVGLYRLNQCEYEQNAQQSIITIHWSQLFVEDALSTVHTSKDGQVKSNWTILPN